MKKTVTIAQTEKREIEINLPFYSKTTFITSAILENGDAVRIYNFENSFTFSVIKPDGIFYNSTINEILIGEQCEPSEFMSARNEAMKWLAHIPYPMKYETVNE